MTKDNFRNAIELLKGLSVVPHCSDHHPVAREIHDEKGYMIMVSCDECGFTSYVHPKAFAEMTA